MDLPIVGYGVIVSPLPTDRPGEIIFAEVTPSPRGRVWREKHIRWWWEILSVEPVTDENEAGATHYWRHDGGAMTFRSAVDKATKAVQCTMAELHTERQGEKV
jgi:hypothetical protein